MIRFARDFRLIPIVLLATIALFALKVSGLVFDGGYTLAERLQGRYKPSLQIAAPESVPEYPKIVIADERLQPGVPGAAQSWAQQMFNYNENANRDVTGSVGQTEKPAGPPLKVNEKPPGPPQLQIGSMAVPIEPGHINSPGERAILESLQGRRQQLDARSRELDMRESLLKATEKRLEAKVAELKDVETRIKTDVGARDAAEAKRFKSIISMYENMKPKDAARIFDRLDMKILVEVATQMNPRNMSEILALMSPDAAQKLTVELANRASAQPQTEAPGQLPKIEAKSPAGT